MKKQFNKEKEYLFISITSGNINPASSINIFFSIPPLPPPSPIFPSSIYHSLNYLVQRSTYHHSIIYPIPFPHSPFLSGSASTHLQLPSSLTSNFSARSHNPFPPPSPSLTFFIPAHNQSSLPPPHPLHFHVFLSINHPTPPPFLGLPPPHPPDIFTYLSNVAPATSSLSIFSPSLTTSSFRVVFQRSTLKIHH